MKHFKFITFLSLIFHFSFFIFHSPALAIIPSGVKAFPPIPFVMSDCHNEDWGKLYPDWGPVGGWWNWSSGQCQDGGATPEEYIRKAKQIRVTLDDGTVIPKPVGIGMRFTLDNIGEWQQRLNKPEFDNLAFLVAESPSLHGEITGAYCKGDICIEDTLPWALNIMTPLANAFPNLPIFFQGGVNTLIPLAELALTQTNNNAAIKANGWIPDLDNALRTVNGVLKGGEMGFATVYHPKLVVGFEPGAGGTGHESEDPKHWYWGVMEALSHHPDFFDIQEPILKVMKETENQYRFPLLKFLRDHLNKTINETPDFWTVLRTSKVKEVCWCGEKASDCMSPDCCYNDSDGNRVCTGPQRSNFSFWLYQKDEISGGRSVALVTKDSPEIPAPAKDHAYGFHTCRRTDQASGNNYLYFDLDDNYQPGLNQNQNLNWEVTVTFVNKGTDKLSLEYINKNGQLIKKSIKKGSSLGSVDNWVDFRWTLNDADFLKNKLNGADFRLNSESDGDEIVHRVLIRPFTTKIETKEETMPETKEKEIPIKFLPGWQKVELKLSDRIPENCLAVAYKDSGRWQIFLNYLNTLFFAPKKKSFWVKCN